MQKLWQEPDPDRKSLCSFVLFGLRGMAAYSYHARVLGYTDGEIDLFFCTALRAIAQERDKDKLFQLVEDTGRMAYRVMAELDKANTGAFGDPEPVEVPLTIEKGPFIVISGHDSTTPSACWSRPRARASMSTPTPRCCLPTATRN